ncbi:MAG: YgjV family protein [Erysipelotrichaceae bacterium]|nr:YgjV family protein [Erysipelotrichaceae bacterium]
MNSIEILGIVATIFIIVAFLMDGELKIRLLDLVGAVLFFVYGYMIRSFSVMLLNGLLVLIQIYKIYQLKKADTGE